MIDKVDNRLQFVDMCKGLGIIAVVIGHTSGGLLSKVMYMFHMPLFFFIGGYLFKIRDNKKSFFWDKTIQLLIPYAVYLSIVYSFMSVLYFKENALTFNSLCMFFIRPFLGGLWLSGYATVFWFVPVFFITQQLFNLILNYFTKDKVIYIILLLLLLGYINNVFFVRIPFDANVVCMSLPIFYCGYLSRKLNFNPKNLIVIILALAGIALTLKGYQNFFDMKYGHYGIPIVTLVSSLALIYSIISLSKSFTKYNILVVFFSFLGEASMVIMYLHQPIQLLIRNYLTEDSLVRGLVSIIVSLLFYFFIRNFTLGRALFLGSKLDMSKLQRGSKIHLQQPLPRI